MLCDAMQSQGFVNFANEWWHYSLGDCLWQMAVKGDWHYDSLEPDVVQLLSDL